MRCTPAVLLCLAAAALAAQAQDSRDLRQARDTMTHVQARAAAGAAPQGQLEDAADALADARDQEILNRTLYARLDLQELAGKAGDEMVEAAERRVARQAETLEHNRQLVAEGALPRNVLAPIEEELAARRKVLDSVRLRSQVVEELAAMVEEQKQAELARTGAPQPILLPQGHSVMEHFEGGGVFSSNDLTQVMTAFEKQFSEPMPISAMGETALHRELGFDHRGRVDVPLNPDQTEGVWLRAYLTAHKIPYYAFRAAVPGKATGAHIHIGPGSTPLRATD